MQADDSVQRGAADSAVAGEEQISIRDLVLELIQLKKLREQT
jgi:hypothetical protein